MEKLIIKIFMRVFRKLIEYYAKRTYIDAVPLKVEENFFAAHLEYWIESKKWVLWLIGESSVRLEITAMEAGNLLNTGQWDNHISVSHKLISYRQLFRQKINKG